MNKQVKAFMQSVADRNPNEPEFLQAVLEVAEVIVPFTSNYPDIQKSRILERITEPERVIIFRVPWVDDKGEVQINR
ncbi:MAG TPA: glutamate dehydrogenase, partial [Chitinophagales bacterium]|nr:glutamate dehydrogenase [Chitinophagales bacterium]